MQIKLPRALLIYCLVLLIQSCGKAETSDSKLPITHVERVGSGVVIFEGAEPEQLFLGKKKAGSAEKCVRAVVVQDADLACARNRCDAQAFYLPLQAVVRSQRALHVVNCGENPELTKGDLLTDKGVEDGSAILYFQASRSGHGMWEQVQAEDSSYAIQFRTEAAEGVLSYVDGQYKWEENAD